MYGDLARAAAAVMVLGWAIAFGAVGAAAQPLEDATASTDAIGVGPAQFQPPNMTASIGSAESNRLTVEVRDAAAGRSADVDVPEVAGDTDTNGELEQLTVHDRGGASRYSFDVAMAETLANLSALTGTQVNAPAAFDSDLVYVDPGDATGGQFDLTYSFDVDLELLREHRVTTDEIVIATYRNGGWDRITETSLSRSGGEVIVDATVPSTEPVALGLQHANLTVTSVANQGRPLLSNRTSQLSLTVENDGSLDGTETFSIEADDRILANATASVPAGETRTVTVPVRFTESGEVPIEVGEYETTINVRNPEAAISLTGITATREVIQPGETAIIEATLHNEGYADGTKRVEFRAFGDTVDAKTVEVPARDRRTVTFEQPIDAPGEYALGVGNHSTAVTVEGTAERTTTSEPFDRTPTPSSQGQFGDLPMGPITIAVGAAVVLLVGVAAVGRASDRS